jgi:cell division septation protein DedD
MKMHTFFLSGKAIAIVSGAFGACAMLLFVSGVLVGVRVQVNAPGRASTPSARATAALETRPATLAAAAPTSPSAAADEAGEPAGPANAAWPFTTSSYVPSPVDAESQPAQSAPAPMLQSPVPAPVTPAAPRRGTVGAVSMISYVATADNRADSPARPETPAARDDAEYLVQVGTFRVEDHAKELADRLTSAGYRATITVRTEGDRSLHVVRVGRFTGIDAAEKAAARIGGAEQLVASVVATRQ